MRGIYLVLGILIQVHFLACSRMYDLEYVRENRWLCVEGFGIGDLVSFDPANSAMYQLGGDSSVYVKGIVVGKISRVYRKEFVIISNNGEIGIYCFFDSEVSTGSKNAD